MSASNVQVIPRVWAVLSVVCLTLIFIYHIVKMCQQSQKKKIKIGKLSTILTCLLFLFGMSRLIGFVLQEFGQSAAICSFCANIGAASYISFKSTLYLILIHRLHHVYKNAPRTGYTAKRLALWALFNLVWGVANLVLVIIFKLEKYNPTQYPYCITGVTHKFVVAMVGLQDLVAGSINIALFVRPLFQFRHMESVKGKKLTRHLRELAVKASVLSVVAIASTIVTLVTIAMVEFHMMVVFIGSDVVVSIFSVILMYTWNQRIYDVLCCCMARNKKTHIESNMSGLDQMQEVNAGQTQLAVGGFSSSTIEVPRASTTISQHPDLKGNDAGAHDETSKPDLVERYSLKLHEKQ